MSSVTHALTRYATASISARLQARQDTGFSQSIPLFIFLFTFIAFSFALIWVDYTCNHVILTLAAIEDPSPDPYIRLQSPNNNDPELADAITLNPKPITSGIRSAIKLLRARGGERRGLISPCLHGFRLYLPFYLLDRGVGFFLNPLFYSGPARLTLASFAVEFLARMCLATLQMGWVHVIVADKAPRARYRRWGRLGHWRRIAPAAAVQNALVCVSYTMYLVAMPTAAWALVNVAGVAHGHLTVGASLRFLVVVLLPPVFSLVSTLPARVVFVRVAASMLPAEDVPVVPFDRRLGGKLRSEVGGGSGGDRLGVRDAWTTCPWSVWVRCFQITFKALGLEVVVVVVGVLVLVGEALLIQLAGPGF
ncbi:hypothetical protein BO82DRAFT_381448 [Aspergillus uvarum CBS 121591]|uniref:Uncharacterized protein n=1 Tax=Aspergillus uvarum CBS 121591 TaxID=1448315 RepID=A0A319D9K7_9EURO|nr:hypothetical protein BO82DRAFT_381448 [Aspergillus uvarum CBS 121591]PYH84668.1 hypothetical protein BO82DRAFT_381448 [Aspergillus uvarum CBS 121591]